MSKNPEKDPNEITGPFGQTRAQMDEIWRQRSKELKARADYIENNPAPYLLLSPQSKLKCSHEWHSYTRYKNSSFGLEEDSGRGQNIKNPFSDICHRCGAIRQDQAGYVPSMSYSPAPHPKAIARVVLENGSYTYAYQSSFKILGSGPNVSQDASTLRWVQDEIEKRMQGLRTRIEHNIKPQQAKFWHRHQWQLVRFFDHEANEWGRFAKLCVDCGAVDNSCSPPIFAPMYPWDYVNELERYQHPAYLNQWLIKWRAMDYLSGHHISQAAQERQNFKSAHLSSDGRRASIEF